MQILRIAGVTAGLAVAGAAAGGLVGSLMALSWLVAEGSLLLHELGYALFMGGSFGGMVGAVLGPVAAWLLMRHVPLWKAIGGTALGTLAVSVAGLLIGGLAASFYAAFLGFGASAVYMRLHTPRPARRALAPSGPA